MNLTHIKPGDKLAIPIRRAWSHVPHVSHDIVPVNRVTATQLVGTWSNGSEVRVNRTTGKILGGILGHAIEATHTPPWSGEHQTTNPSRDRPSQQS